MEYNLPTIEECLNIIKNTESFYMTETKVDNYNVRMFDYRLASISDFVENKAFELRGLTFIENPITKEWERNLLLNKFFNYNQTIGWLEEDFLDKKIIRVQDKLDGSIISFCKFPNNKVYAKSKMSFESFQAKNSQIIYENNKQIKDFLNMCFEKEITPIFEYVSYKNQIVVNYNEDKLVLLQIRDNKTGKFFDKKEIEILNKDYQLELAKDLDEKIYDLKKLLQIKKESKEDIEGFVITFEDGKMAKIKTDHYLYKHHLIGDNVFRENLLIETILNDSIDDVISNLQNNEKKKEIENIVNKINKYFNHLVVEFKELRKKYFVVYNENKKEFALDNSKIELFSLVVKTLNNKSIEIEEKEIEKIIKEYIIKKTNKLDNAKQFLTSI